MQRLDIELEKKNMTADVLKRKAIEGSISCMGNTKLGHVKLTDMDAEFVKMDPSMAVMASMLTKLDVSKKAV